MVSSSVSVVVVSFNTREKLHRCLSAIEERHEVIVVDNASIDGSADMVAEQFPRVKLIRSDRNLGFGSANNVGIDQATRPLVLLLNSDCYAEPGAVDELERAFEDPKVVAAGGKLLNTDGSLQESVAGELKLKSVFLEQSYLELLVRRLVPRWAYFRTRWALKACAGEPAPCRIPVSQCMGACLMVRPLERFDERFFLYCEDTDLCLRLRRHGYITYVPTAAFTHELGSSSTHLRWKAVARYNYGKELYFRIHHGQIQSLACLALDRLGAVLRIVLWSILLRPGKVGTFWRVLTCPMSGPSGS